MFKEFLDKDLIDPVERKELQSQIESLNKAGLLFTSPLYKMRKEKVDIDYSKLWEQMVIAHLTKKIEGITWEKPAEIQEKEVLSKKVAKAEIDTHPDNLDSNERKGWGFVTQDKNEHFKSTLPKDESKSKRRSSMGLSTLTSLISALTSTNITVESVSSNEDNNVIVVQTSSDEPLMSNRIIGACIARRDSDSSSRSSSPEPPKKTPPPPPPSELSKKGESEVMKKLIAQNEEETAKTKMMEKVKERTEEFKMAYKNDTPKESPKPTPRNLSSSPVKRDLSQSKIPNSPKKADSNLQKGGKDNIVGEQKEKIKTIIAENIKIIKSRKDENDSVQSLGKQDMKSKMDGMKCYGCNKMASEIYQNSMPKTFVGKANQQMVFPRLCHLCFSENQQFFCSKKCLSSGEKNHVKKCKLAQVQRSKSFFETLNL